MNRKEKFIVAEGIMLIVWIITTIYFVAVVFQKGPKCIANPLVYGVKTLQEKNNNTVFTCTCQFENSPNYAIFVDSKHWEVTTKENTNNIQGLLIPSDSSSIGGGIKK